MKGGLQTGRTKPVPLGSNMSNAYLIYWIYSRETPGREYCSPKKLEWEPSTLD